MISIMLAVATRFGAKPDYTGYHQSGPFLHSNLELDHLALARL